MVGDLRERDAGFLGFDDADGFAVDEKQVVAAAFFQTNFADGDAARRGEVELLVVLDDPAALLKQRVDFLAGEFLRGRHEALISSGGACFRQGKKSAETSAGSRLLVNGCWFSEKTGIVGGGTKADN